MLIAVVDYPVHQTPLPLAQAGSGNPNFYDRFWFNGFREELILGVAFCSYPNKQIMDGASLSRWTTPERPNGAPGPES
jgi:hypothetical protein